MERSLFVPSATVKPPDTLSEIVGNMQASYLGIVLGLAGLGNAWRGTSRAWQLPAFIAEYVLLVAGVVWALLIIVCVLKALLTPAKLAAEPWLSIWRTGKL